MEDESESSRLLSEHFLTLYSKALLKHTESVARRHCCGCEVDHPSQSRHSCLMWPVAEKVCTYFDEIVDCVDADSVTRRWCVDIASFAIDKGFLAMYKLKYVCVDWRTIEVASPAWREKLYKRTCRLIVEQGDL